MVISSWALGAGVDYSRVRISSVLGLDGLLGWGVAALRSAAWAAAITLKASIRSLVVSFGDSIGLVMWIPVRGYLKASRGSASPAPAGSMWEHSPSWNVAGPLDFGVSADPGSPFKAATCSWVKMLL